MATIEREDDDDSEPELAVIPANLSHVFPSLSVVENGLLEKWVFAADIIPTLLTAQVSIEFQIWRGVGDQAALHSTSVVSAPVRSGYPNVYEHTVDPPQPVLAGDYVGIRVQLGSQLQPLWQPGSGPLYLLFNNEGEGNGTGQATPLFAAQIRGTLTSIFIFNIYHCYILSLFSNRSDADSTHNFVSSANVFL